MSTTRDPLVGTWTLNPGNSQFDANHRPQAATLVIERDADGTYVIKAEGISEKGQKVTEKAQTLVADGQPRPVPDVGMQRVGVRARRWLNRGAGNLLGLGRRPIPYRDHGRIRLAAAAVRAAYDLGQDERLTVTGYLSRDRR